jgi:hypothetical protein
MTSLVFIAIGFTLQRLMTRPNLRAKIVSKYSKIKEQVAATKEKRNLTQTTKQESVTDKSE